MMMNAVKAVLPLRPASEANAAAPSTQATAAPRPQETPSTSLRENFGFGAQMGAIAGFVAPMHAAGSFAYNAARALRAHEADARRWGQNAYRLGALAGVPAGLVGAMAGATVCAAASLIRRGESCQDTFEAWYGVPSTIIAAAGGVWRTTTPTFLMDPIE